MVPTAPAKQHTASSHRMHRTHRSLGGAEVSHRLHRGIQIFLAEIFSHRLHRTRRTLGHPPKCVLWEDTLLGWCSWGQLHPLREHWLPHTGNAVTACLNCCYRNAVKALPRCGNSGFYSFFTLKNIKKKCGFHFFINFAN